MHATGFSSSNCHTTQHMVVLQVMREGVRRGATGQLDVTRQMAHELAGWFPQHAQSMDAALALHLRSVDFDFDFATGRAALLQALPTDAIQGCGSGACSPSPIPAATMPEPAAA